MTPGHPVNRLAAAVSPYLRQHAANPVAWQPWDADALALAQRLDRPIVLSIGYAACHWCHVMARESFADPATAAVMNALFVSIKVDREERPDLDRLFLGALSQLGRPAGWPLTAFLTPAGEPYWGGGYFPTEPAFELPAFKDVLRQAAKQYAARPADAGERGRTALTAVAVSPRGTGTTVVSHALLDRVAHQLVRSMDDLYGGFGIDPPKFLHVGGHELVLRAAVRIGEAGLRRAVIGSLQAICRGGVYDHLGGGFHRYAVDDRWRVPHFEKMLCDNALMISLLVKAWQVTGATGFAAQVAETVDWLLREMRLACGAFGSSLSAEADGGAEGATYTWGHGETEHILAGEHPRFAAAYGLSAEGPFAGRAVIYRHDGVDAPVGRDLLDRLHRARAAARPPPFRDDKVLADWNGLAITALVEAGLAFDRPDWIAAARTAFDAVVGAMADGDGLCHSMFGRRRGPAGFLEDYACMAQAALTLGEATAACAERARAWVDRLDALFWDGEGGGYYGTAVDAGPVLVRQNLIDETVAPSGNGTMLGVLTTLAALTGEASYRRRAERIVSRFGDRLTRASVAAATALNNADLNGLIQVVIVAAPDGAAAAAFRRVVGRRFVPARLMVIAGPDAAVPHRHPAKGKRMVGGQATAYVCIGTTCLAPVTDPVMLGDLLDKVVGTEQAEPM